MAPPKKIAKKAAKQAPKPQPVGVGTGEICRLLAGDGQESISEMHLSRLVADGMPKLARGLYDPHVCMHWYLGKLRIAVQRKATEGDDGKARNLMDERARLTAAQADTAEMDRDERRGALIPLGLYEQRLNDWAVNTKQRVLGIVPRLVDKLEGMPRAKLRVALEDALKGCLTDVATGRVQTAAADLSSGDARKRTKH